MKVRLKVVDVQQALIVLRFWWGAKSRVRYVLNENKLLALHCTHRTRPMVARAPGSRAWRATGQKVTLRGLWATDS
jgi:hypothetical protein